MKPRPATDVPAPSPGAELTRRIRWPRTAGLGLGALCVAGGLWQHAAPGWLWGLLALNGLAWPQLAYALALRSPAPRATELRNLLVDSAAGGFWVAAMGYNLLPSVLILTMVAMNNVAVGGTRLFVRGAAAQAAGVLAGSLLLAPGLEPAATLRTILLALPFMVVYPLIIGLTTYRLSAKLARQKRELERSEHLHRATLDSLDAGIVLYDASDRLVLCNASFREVYGALGALLQTGQRFEELLRSAVQRGLIPEAAGREEAWIAERVWQHDHPQGPLLRELPGDRWRRIVEQRLPDGGRLGFSIDVTELVRKRRALEQAEREAREARGLLQDAIDALPEGFALFDAADRLVMCNDHYRKMYAASAPAIQEGKTFEELLRYGLARGQYPAALGREDEWLAERLDQHRNPPGPLLQELPGNRWLRIDERKTRNGSLAGMRTDVTDLIQRGQELQRLYKERDVYAQQLREANARLERLSETDALTGLANRRLFDRRLAEEWAHAAQRGTPLSLLMIDVDHFKRFNDRHGHQEGDACLREVAQILHDCALRAGDLVARYGGEEFAVLLPQTGGEDAARIAQRCLDAVDAAAIPHGDSPTAGHVTLSIGVAVAQGDDPASDARTLLRSADAALYRAKRHGRHRAMVRETSWQALDTTPAVDL
ncbi:MAG: diguanylate cyclase [Pseudomonadota bacterium]